MPKRVTSLQDQRHDIGFDRCHDNTAPFDEKSQECWAVGNSVFDLTGPGLFEPQTSHTRADYVTGAA